MASVIHYNHTSIHQCRISEVPCEARKLTVTRRTPGGSCDLPWRQRLRYRIFRRRVLLLLPCQKDFPLQHQKGKLKSNNIPHTVLPQFAIQENCQWQPIERLTSGGDKRPIMLAV
jgi:hypothetical protein